MFTPSLVSIMLHSVWGRYGGVHMLRPLPHPSIEAIAAEIQRLASDVQGPVPEVPVTGYSRESDAFRMSSARTNPTGGTRYPPSLFGRIPVDELARRFAARHSIDSKAEYLDLGTPLFDAHAGPNAGEADMDACKRLIPPRTNLSPPSMMLVVIDRGHAAYGRTPDDFNGRVHHLLDQGVVFSQHAADVLQTLLTRLADHQLVSDVDLVAGLVCPPSNAVGPDWYAQANMVELHDMLGHLAQHRSRRHNQTMVCNISMGTHVGPHLGNTPFELEVEQILPMPRNIFVCSAGNDGMAGGSASITLRPGVMNYLRLKTSPAGCQQLLVEFWWESKGSPPLEAVVTVRDAAGAVQGLPLKIDPRTAGQTFRHAGPGARGYVCQSLYQMQCLGSSHCLAFALSGPVDAALASLTIDIDILSHTSLTLRGWVVLPRPDRCWFVGVAPATTVSVPATLPEGLCVAGLEARQPWRDSSRGEPHWGQKPTLAYRAEFPGANGQMGTSFAAPRAAADVVQACITPWHTRNHRPTATTHATSALLMIVQNILTRHSGLSPAWDERTGFGIVTQGA